MIERERDMCRACKIVLGSVAKTALRAVEAEKILVGKKFKDTLVEKASQQASEEIQPITDVRSTAWYRREISKILVRDAIILAWSRAVSSS